MTQQSVLVVEAQRYVLTIARSLNAAGLRVILGQSPGDTGNPVFASRAVSEAWAHPTLKRPEQFVAALHAFLADRRDVVAVFPAGENAARALATVDGSVPALVMCSRDALWQCLDKHRSLELIRECGIPCLPGCTVADAEALRHQGRRLGLPLALKPRNASQRVFGRKCYFVDSDTELEQLGWPGDADELIVQPRIEGFRHNCMFLADRGSLVRYFESQVRQTDEPDGTGYGTFSVSVAPCERRRAYVERVISRLEYSGLGCMQFLVDPATGDMAFLELNPRIDATCALPVGAGFDYPLWAVQLALGQLDQGDLPTAYRIGVTHAWSTGAIEAWRDARNETPRGSARPSLANLVMQGIRADTHATWTSSDPMPTMTFYWQRVRRAASKLVRSNR